MCGINHTYNLTGYVVSLDELQSRKAVAYLST